MAGGHQGWVYDGQNWQLIVGPEGPAGKPMTIRGTVATIIALPPVGMAGDAFIVQADGHLYAWDDTAKRWNDGGVFRGPKGDPGETLHPNGIVPDISFLASLTPAHLDVYVTQNDHKFYVYDQNSPAAIKPGNPGEGWVDMGSVQGPKGDTGPQGPRGMQIKGTAAGQALIWDPGTLAPDGSAGDWAPTPLTLGPVMFTNVTTPANNDRLPLVYDDSNDTWTTEVIDFDAIAGLIEELRNDRDTLIYNATDQTFHAGKLFLGDLSNVDPTAPAAGDVLTWDATNRVWAHVAGPMPSNVIFTGNGAFNPANAGDRAQNYGMAADTTPDPKVRPPRYGDRYYNLQQNDDTIVFTGVVGIHDSQVKLITALNGVANTVGKGMTFTVVGDLIQVRNRNAPARSRTTMMWSNDMTGTNVDMPAVGTTIGFTESTRARRTLTHVVTQADFDDKTGATLVAAINSLLLAAPWNGEWNARSNGFDGFEITANINGEFQAPDPSLGPTFYRMFENLQGLWGHDYAHRSAFVDANAFSTGNANMGYPDYVLGASITADPPLTVTTPTSGTGTAKDINVPVDTALGNTALGITIGGQRITVTPVHDLGYYEENRSGAMQGDFLGYINNRWVPVQGSYSRNDIDTRMSQQRTTIEGEITNAQATLQTQINQMIVGMEHGVAVQAIQKDPPAAPVVDEFYIVAPSATGAWVGHVNDVAHWDGTAWVFDTPQAREAHLVEALGEIWTWNDTGKVWVKAGAVGSSSARGTSVGMIAYFPKLAVPSGWLVCDGSTFDQNTYPDLATFLGGNTLPNLDDKFFRAKKIDILGVHNDTTRYPRNPIQAFASEAGAHSHKITVADGGAVDAWYNQNPTGMPPGNTNWVGGPNKITVNTDTQHVIQDSPTHWHNIEFRSGWDSETAPKHINLVAAMCALDIGKPGPAGPQGLQGVAGAPGAKGDRGPAGETLKVNGVVGALTDLPATTTHLDVRVVQANGHLYVYDPTSTGASTGGVGATPAGWVDLGKIQGPQGDPGPAGSITVGTVTAVPPASPAQVINRGTPGASILDFQIPRGQQGPAGVAGPPGPQGAAGTVAIGTVTKVASTAPAAVRDTGTPGAAVLNFDIPIGPAGPQGPAGPAGADMKVQVITAADYAALATPDPTTLYLISS